MSKELLEQIEKYKRLRSQVNKTIDYLIKVSEASNTLTKSLNDNYLVNDMPSLTAEKAKDLSTSITSTIDYLRTVIIPECDNNIASLTKMQVID